MKKQQRDKRIFFDLNHPADFHFFKNLFDHLRDNRYVMRIMARDKECLQDLLTDRDIAFVSRGTGHHTLFGKYIFAIYILLYTLFQLIRFRPGLTISLSSPYLITASKILGVPSLTYDDTDDNPRLLPLIKKSDYIISPATYSHKFHKHHFHLQAFKELAYLHPKYFIHEKTGEGVFFRLTRTDSIHHTSESKFEYSNIIEQINRISQDHTCFLSTEIGMTPEFSEKVLMADVVNIHKDLQKCKVFWGNSATMAAEAAVLGIPAIFVGSELFSYIKELGVYGLLFHYHPGNIEASLEKLDELIAGDDDGNQFERARQKLLKEKIDISAFMIWFIENLPESARIMEDDPDYHLRFIS